ncbi:MAG: calcium-binding protein [Polyangiaceae bacterium]
MRIGFGAWHHARRPGSTLTRLSSRLLICVGLAVSACGQAPGSTPAPTPTAQIGAAPDVAQSQYAILSSNCTVTSTTMTVTVNADETALVGLDVDGKVSANGTQASGAPCETSATGNITVTYGTPGAHKVYLDLANGLFSKANSWGANRIRIDLGGGANDTLTVHGSAYSDHLYFGKGTLAGIYLLNFNGGTGPGYDSFADVSIIGVENVIVNGAEGDDIIDASGLFGTNAPYPVPLTLFGGAGNDVITGGAGDDILSGDDGNDLLNGGAGYNTYSCGAANDGSDVITVAKSAIDTVDYSRRFNTISVLLDGSASSGEAGENDAIPDTVFKVIGGSGNDSISAAGSRRLHTLMGGPGNDTLIGGAADTLDGGNGVLAVDGDDLFIGSKAAATYAYRWAPITVTVNGSGNGGVDANDGDPASTRHVQTQNPAAAGATISAATNTVTGLANMNAGSVGHVLIITGSTAAHDDGSYRIVSVQSPTSVVLNATDTAGKANWTNDSGATWSFAEDAGPERDEVRCASVIGSANAINTLTGDSQDNWLTGGTQNDVLVGGPGSDTLNGLDGDDTLFGGAGDDTLIGGPGNDTLHGGDGNDVLEGDANSDSFDCDGNNALATPGSAPGGADFTVDYKPGDPDYDTRAAASGCD